MSGEFDDTWSGLSLDSLPKTGIAAEAIGSRFFFTGERCVNGHLSPKYSKGGRCVDCTALAAAITRGGSYSGAGAVAKAAIVRAIAAVQSKSQYVPARPCKSGHSLRWTASNNCVQCGNDARERRKETAKERRLIDLYGLDFAGKARLAESQGNACKVCGSALGIKRATHVDHCHDTGKVRGLLCSKCNQGIGLFCDNPEIMRNAARYVEDARA